MGGGATLRVREEIAEPLGVIREEPLEALDRNEVDPDAVQPPGRRNQPPFSACILITML